MQIAANKDGQRVAAEDFQRGDSAFCQTCGKIVRYKSGALRRPYFSHLPGQDCLDHWRHEDMCEWHLDWQQRFPSDAQEVVFANGEEKHRADVSFKDVVIEFQHSSLSPEEFSERNAFYARLGKRVVWLFDAVEGEKKGRFSPYLNETSEHIHWSFIPKALIPFLRGEDPVPFVFLQVSDNPIQIYWIKPEIDLCLQVHGFCLLSKLTEAAFLSFVRFLASPAESKDFQKGEVPLVVDYLGYSSRIAFSPCHLSPDGLSEAKVCEECPYLLEKAKPWKIRCAVAKITGENAVAFQPFTLSSIIANEQPIGPFIYFFEEVGCLVSHIICYKGDTQNLYGYLWEKTENGKIEYRNIRKIDYAQINHWRLIPQNLFPEVDFSPK